MIRFAAVQSNARGARARARASVGAIVLALAIACLTAGGGRAAAGVFTVTGVAVDATAETAAVASEQALVEGRREALDRLFARLTLRGDRDRLPRPEGAGLEDLIASFEVANEKTSPVRYLAELTFHFERHAVRALLRGDGIPFAETRSRPILVLPVYRLAGAASLWDAPNPWRSAWAGLAAPESLAPLVLPAGDLTDIATIGAEQALAGNTTRLDAVARRYGAANVLLAVADLRMDTTRGLPVIDLQARWFGDAAPERTLIDSVAANSREDISPALTAAAAKVAEWVAESWKRDNLLRFDHESEMILSVPLAGLDEWLDIRARLAEVAVIRGGALLELSRDEARLALRYLGGEDQLRIALAQQELSLSRDATDWVLRRRRAPEAGR
ncbi:MAG: DUF2066 domain-containing protein [Alphaproteobacteria bacterium]